ncbi:glycosyltransferase family 2 protein [Flavobacterium undicola]|uniref:glycosyltransferase family 2 protein n=1 Tax=Flavobacterium undicola TaxID=1932779 RepID=UPI0013773E63|nr:glycosyltransferase family 2 protein [Flavobacterium undicola]MBA0884379.1 glycosyltransferase family 2 protein [Flavobacterium undicola]
MSNKLLSICIPTYNRAEVLDETLKKLFFNPEFNVNLIEVIVSDNCSTDNTTEVVGKYPLVRYYRNEENIKDRNYSVVLEYATGSYIKLFNDTLLFKEGALKAILDRIEKHRGDDSNLFFYGNTFLYSNCEVEICYKKKYLNTVSFLSTWIANFGVWREDFEKIKNKDRYAELQFVQVDWSYRIIENNKKTIIYFEDLFDVITPNKKGGYNVFDTFINKYLSIIKQEKFSLLSYEIEKYRLCRYFVYPWLLTLFVNNKQFFVFDTNGVVKIIFKKYWYELYLYPMLISFWLKKITR